MENKSCIFEEDTQARVGRGEGYIAGEAWRRYTPCPSRAMRGTSRARASISVFLPSALRDWSGGAEARAWIFLSLTKPIWTGCGQAIPRRNITLPLILEDSCAFVTEPGGFPQT